MCVKFESCLVQTFWDWIGLLKSDYSYLIKYTVLLETISSDKSNDPYNLKDASIQGTEVPAMKG
jgi:hypothetical protein